jgi:hypothetical protein
MDTMTIRHVLITQLPVAALVSRSVFAANKRVSVGVDVSLAGADAEDAILVKNGAMRRSTRPTRKAAFPVTISRPWSSTMALPPQANRSGTGGDQCAQDGLGPQCGCRSGP